MTQKQNQTDPTISEQDRLHRGWFNLAVISDAVDSGLPSTHYRPISWLENQMCRHMPHITGQPVPDRHIQVAYHNEVHDEKYGRTIQVSGWLKTPIKDGVYFDPEGCTAIIVQGNDAIAFIVKGREWDKYNEVMQMDNYLICRGDKKSSAARKRLGFDGNYTPNKICVEAFPVDMPRSLMACIQYVHRFCINSIGYEVVHTRGYCITNEGGQDFRDQQVLKDYVRDLIPREIKVVKNFHPEELEGLEFDIWVPDLNIAIEYQGKQHFEPVKNWGGVDGLKARQEKDKLKRILAKKAGIALKEIRYDEEITRESVRGLLYEALIDLNQRSLKIGSAESRKLDLSKVNSTLQYLL